MDSASRVSHIATSSSIGSGSHYSRHSSRGCSSDGKGGRGGHLSVSSMVVSMVNRGCIAINSSIVSNSTISNRGSSMDNRGSTIATIPSISHTLESRVSKTISSISSISNAIVSSIIRISLSLGHMDSASRVSNIATSSSIGSGSHYSRHSSRGCSSNGKGGGGGHLCVSNIAISMVKR